MLNSSSPTSFKLRSLSAALLLAGLFKPALAKSIQVDTNELSTVEIAVSVTSTIIYALLQIRDLWILFKAEALTDEQQLVIRSRLIMIQINYLKDLIWSFLTGIDLATTMLQNTLIGLSTFILAPLFIAIAALLQCCSVVQLNRTLVHDFIKYSVAGGLGLIAWSAPLQSSTIMNGHIAIQGLSVGLTDAFAQTSIIALYDYALSNQKAHKGWLLGKMIWEAFINVPSGAVWLWAVSIPQANGGRAIDANLSFPAVMLSAFSVASCTAVMSYICNFMAGNATRCIEKRQQKPAVNAQAAGVAMVVLVPNQAQKPTEMTRLLSVN